MELYKKLKHNARYYAVEIKDNKSANEMQYTTWRKNIYSKYTGHWKCKSFLEIQYDETVYQNATQ